MPANVSIEFEKAKIKYEQANSPAAKLAALLEMQSKAPKHKGGENLRAEISKKIALLKEEIAKQKLKEKKKGSSSESLAIKKEGSGQIALIGLPNSGKSTLLNLLSNANVTVALYPFTTKKPEVAMLDFEGAKIQLVEVPALLPGSADGKAQGTQLLSIIRSADALIVVARSKEEETTIKEELKKAKILLNEKKPKIFINQSKFKGISISGKQFSQCKEQELIDFLHSNGILNAEIVLSEETDLKKIAQVLDESIVYKNALTVNPFNELNLQDLKQKIFLLLERVLVYTKKPGQKIDYNKPLVLKKGSTINDVAKNLHKDFSKKLRYAKVWGSTKFPGQRVQKEYKIKNMDVIELYC